MPSFKELDADKKQTPGIKLKKSSIKKLQYVCNVCNISQSAFVEMQIENEYKKLKGDKKMKAIFTETHPDGEQTYKVEEVLLCRYIPAGTFDIKSINRPYDTVLINPQDNPLSTELKTLIDPDVNGFESRTLEFNRKHYRK